MRYEAIIKATSEKLIVYKLQNGNYFDFNNMSSGEPPSAPKANKKEFESHEITIIKEIK